ncbi:Cu-Zn family superoxide dismutase [Oxalobacteraceae bacterium GrIS 1.11]
MQYFNHYIEIIMRLLLALTATLLLNPAFGGENILHIPVNTVDEKGTLAAIGEVSVSESPYGLVFTPALSGLPAGIHGFHIHENASCDPAQKDGKPVAALAAGGHWDTEKTNRHAGPYGNGHIGDLPALYVSADGKASYPVLAPRLHTLNEIRGHALMLHLAGDNHADQPAALGGGGARLACGVIPKA